MNWTQIGEDFRQKYEGTYCRYLSPITKMKEVFAILGVTINSKSAPDITLYNGRVGELFLTYNTETELDFEFPEVGMFQHEKKALCFRRRYMRQWKKGVCDGTAIIDWGYGWYSPQHQFSLSESTLESAFKPKEITSIANAIQKLSADYISVALSKHLSLGLSDKEGKYWLWFNNEPIAEVTDTIRVRIPQFTQEVRDFLRDTRDYARIVI